MCFFVQAEDGIRDLVRSRGLGDVYKRQARSPFDPEFNAKKLPRVPLQGGTKLTTTLDTMDKPCLLYTSDAADERSSVDLGGRRIIKKKKNKQLE